MVRKARKAATVSHTSAVLRSCPPPRRVQGRGNSAYVYCNAASQAQATMFQFPVRSFYSVRLQSELSQQFCGATFIVMDPFAQ